VSQKRGEKERAAEIGHLESNTERLYSRGPRDERAKPLPEIMFKLRKPPSGERVVREAKPKTDRSLERKEEGSMEGLGTGMTFQVTGQRSGKKSMKEAPGNKLVFLKLAWAGRRETTALEAGAKLRRRKLLDDPGRGFRNEEEGLSVEEALILQDPEPACRRSYMCFSV